MSSAAAASTPVPRKISIAIVVPSVLVNDHASGPIPLSIAKHGSFIPSRDPLRPWIRRQRPVAFVPHVLTLHGIPVTGNPDVGWLRRRGWGNVDNLGWRRRADVNADRN